MTALELELGLDGDSAKKRRFGSGSEYRRDRKPRGGATSLPRPIPEPAHVNPPLERLSHRQRDRPHARIADVEAELGVVERVAGVEIERIQHG